MAQAGLAVTRGLGPGAIPSGLILRGIFVPPIVDAVRGALRSRRRVEKVIAELLEDLKVGVSLVAINGKDLVAPIFNTVRSSYIDEPTPRIEVTPTKLAVRQPEIKVKATQIRSKNVND